MMRCEAIIWQNKPPADLKEEPPEPVFSKFPLCLNPEHRGHGHQVTALKITPSALIFSDYFIIDKNMLHLRQDVSCTVLFVGETTPHPKHSPEGNCAGGFAANELPGAERLQRISLFCWASSTNGYTQWLRSHCREANWAATKVNKSNTQLITYCQLTDSAHAFSARFPH